MHNLVMPLIDYFIAADDATAARVVAGSGGPESNGFDTLSAQGIDPSVALGNLESIMTGCSYSAVTDQPRHCDPNPGSVARRSSHR
jgi:hypothetical protein